MHPSLPRTYVPGWARTKAAMTAAGCAMVLLGLAQVYPPLWATLAGSRCQAVVVQIVETRTGAPDEVFSAAQVVPSDESRRAIFWSIVALPHMPGTAPTVAKLNVATQVSAVYVPGEAVDVAYLPARPGYAYAVRDLRTWVPGGLLLVFGLVFAAAFALLWCRARQAIELPLDGPSPVWP